MSVRKLIFLLIITLFLSAINISYAQKGLPKFLLQNGHSDHVTTVKFSPSGMLLASGSKDNIIKLWDANSGKLINNFKGHSGEIYKIAFSPDNKSLASCGEDQSIIIWDISTGKIIQTLKGHSNSVQTVDFSPNGKILASGSLDNTVKLWNINNGNQFHTFVGHTKGVYAVHFSSDGRKLSSGDSDGIVKVWDLKSKKNITSYKGHITGIRSVIFSPDNNTIASGGWDYTIKLWDVSSKKIIKTLVSKNSGTIDDLAFSPDGKILASANQDGTIKLWDISSKKIIKTLKGDTGFCLTVAFSPNGKKLASGGMDNTVKLWNISSGNVINTLKANSTGLHTVVFSSDGKTIASGGWDKSIKIWDAHTGKLKKTLSGHSIPWVNSIVFSPDNKIIASGGADNTIKLWDSTTGKLIKTLTGHSDYVDTVAFSPDGNILASGSRDSYIKLWDVSSNKLIATLKGQSGGVEQIIFSPDGNILASAYETPTIKLWEVNSGIVSKTLFTENEIGDYREWPKSILFSKDGKVLFVGNDDHTIKLIDVSSAKVIKTLYGHSGAINTLSFSPDGKILVSGSSDNTIKLWETNSFNCIKTLKGHTGDVNSLSFSPDGKKLASVSLDTSIRVWDMIDQKELLVSYAINKNDFISITPQGYYTSSDNGEKFVAWRIGNEVYTFEQYAIQLNKPNFITRALDGRDLPVTKFDMVVKTPPTLFWLNPTHSTDVQHMEIVLRYKATSTLHGLMCVHNHKPIDLKIDYSTNKKEGEIRIPIELSEYNNSLLIHAIDANRLQSWLPINFQYEKGSVTSIPKQKADPWVDLFTLESKLPQGAKVISTLINGKPSKFMKIDIEKDLIRLRAPKNVFEQLEDGAHRVLIKIKSGIRTYFIDPINFWKEMKKLHKYVETRGNKYAVIIGIGKYKKNYPDLTDLPSAPEQAKELGEYLAQNGFKVKYFVDDNKTIDKITISNYLFGTLNPILDPDRDVLFFYFGGHGKSYKNMLGDDVGYLLLNKYDRNNVGATAISMVNDIRQRYVSELRAKHILFAIDACMADVGLRNATPTVEDLRNFTQLADIYALIKKTGRTILTAGSDGQAAIDINGGIFTKSLIRGLKGNADFDKNGVIEINELETHIRREVTSKAKQLSLEQDPGRFNIPVNGGQFLHFYRGAGVKE